MRRPPTQILPLAALTLVACEAPISVRVEPATPPTARVVSEDALSAARQLDDDRPLHSIATTVGALREASNRVAAGEDAAIPEYNYLTARLVDQLGKAGVQPWQRQLELDEGGTRTLLRGTQPDDLDVAGRRFLPSDRLHFSGRYANEEAIKPGVGAPLVAFLPITEQGEDEPPGPRLDSRVRYRTITALVNFSGNTATVDLVDPFRTEWVSVGGRRLPLQADFGSNVGYGLSTERIDKLGLARLLNPSRYDDTARLLAIQPYDPDRIPVLFVHGLQDTPASFAPMYFELMEDPWIRETYQFWAFSYPSGYPYPMPAAQLREELDRFSERFPGHKDIVLVGHSMGGLISRLMVTDVGDGMWTRLLGSPPAETPLRGESRELLEQALVFNARDDIDRVVFFSAPHRGSKLASNIIGWIGVKLVRLPGTLADVMNTVVNTVSLDAAGFQLDRFPSSIDTLSPTNAFVKGINTFPIRSGIPYHTVVGDRGKGDTPDSSDGVVDYWSSHLDGAVSEKVVPSGHGSHQDPQGIEEMRRILHLHAGRPYTPKPVEVAEPPEFDLRHRGPPSKR